MIRQLTYGNVADSLDEYLQMSEQTSKLDAFDAFRMLGSIPTVCIGCGKRCPKAWQGQFTRCDKGHPTIMLEVVALFDDIYGLNQSHLFREIIEDTAPDTSFTVNGTDYQNGYYLADGIYPEWGTFVKAFSCPQDAKKKNFKKYQESARKYVERAFGVIQGRWVILTHPSRSFSVNKIRRTMYACVILHNMIVEDSGHAITSYDLEILAVPPRVPIRTFRERMAVHARTNRELPDRGVLHGLRHNLVEHIWRLP
uniref:uncharacterized protein LOC122609707 n=1 Tax=Erigeron canadensis TaxID=72917 RepID=UPI001CB9CB65|nr:uncharacterized protein LOC122609707 [Erigeron canadensis]